MSEACAFYKLARAYPVPTHGQVPSVRLRAKYVYSIELPDLALP